MSKTFKIVDNDMSDGYHTFDELYRHRNVMFIYSVMKGAFKATYVVEDHFPGWDLIVTNTFGNYEQVSYHVPMEYRELYIQMPRKTTKEHKKIYDGHTSNQVLERMVAALTNKLEGSGDEETR